MERTKETISCRNCVISFTTYRSAKRKFCDNQCSHAYLGSRHKAPWLSDRNRRVNAEQARRTAKQRSITLRRKNLAARGGAPKKGYLSHVGGGHIHRTIARKLLGRSLKKGEIVHHINGDIHDNRPKNLRILSRSDHFRIHVRGEVV